MRPRFFRFTIRRSMAVVAAIAALMGSGIMVQRLMQLRAVYQARAAYHDREEQVARGVMKYASMLKNPDQKNEAAAFDLDTDPDIQQMLMRTSYSRSDRPCCQIEGSGPRSGRGNLRTRQSTRRRRKG